MLQTAAVHSQKINTVQSDEGENSISLMLSIPKKPTSIISFDPQNGHVIYNPITLFSKRETSSLVTIRSHYNYELCVSDQHPVFVWDEHTSAPKIKLAQNVSIGDLLVFPRILPTTIEPESSFNVLEILKTKFPSLIKKLRVKLNGDNFRNYKSILDKYYRGNDKKQEYLKSNSLPLEAFLLLQKEFALPLEKILLASGRGPSFSTIPARITLDNDLARLIGYYLSEGCITEEKKTMRIRWTFHEDETEYIEDVCSILKRKGIRYSIYADHTSHTQHIKVSSIIFALFFREVLQTGVNCYAMKIPTVLFESNPILRTEVLKGILRGDGGVSYSNKKHTYRKNGRLYTHTKATVDICYFTSSPLLLEQVQFILREIGIVPKRNRREGLLTFHGKESAEKLKNLFDGKKRHLIETYLMNLTKPVHYAFAKFDGPYLLIRVKDIQKKEQNVPVYSLEVAHANTLLINGGIAVHNCIPDDPC